MIWRVLLAIGALTTAVVVLTSPGRYLARGAWEEGRILAKRQSIERLVHDSTVNAATRAKLRLVLDARDFAQQTLQLNAKKSFTTFTQLDSDTLVLVLTVAYRDRLAIHTWWWPIVGRVPYKGYFDFGAAKDAQKDWEKKGYDTDLRPSSAFSTLGWFNDPLLSTTLDADSTFLVNTVVHELLHNTVWIPGDVSFNESFASFVGREGARMFFEARHDSASVAELRRNAPLERAIGKFYETLYGSLDSAFKAHPGEGASAARIAARDTVFTAARLRLATEIAPAFGIRDTTWAKRFRLNIATVLARRVYREDADEFDAALKSSGGDLRNAIIRIGAAARAAPKGHALEALRKLQ
ncbi:MAG TPA: aminopeptidase [Gemmatimonadaceae bacterium]|nr:aminopeptidase [Gemmatimonadaceae bacterium]